MLYEVITKDLEEEMEVSCDLRQFEGYRVVEHIVLYHDDLKAINTEAVPGAVSPLSNGNASIADGSLSAVLKKQSWNVIRMAK